MLTLAALALSFAGLPQDPEATPQGRTHFLGREVAQTMHWLGAEWLMRETREEEEHGIALRSWLDVRPGQAVCDLGCGNGYHALPLADAIGPEGALYAVDLQPEMLAMLAQLAEAARLRNVRCIEAAVDDPRLERASCDLVLMVDVYHELSHPVRVMGHVREALRAKGRVVLVEFRAEDPSVPIKPEHTMSKAQVVREMAAHGFGWVDELGARGEARLPWQHALAFEVRDPRARHEAREVLGAYARAVADKDEREIAPFLGTGAKASAVPKDSRAELRAGSGSALWARLENEVGDVEELELDRDGVGRWLVVRNGPEPLAPRTHGSKRRFVAMNTGTRGPLDEQATLLAELGFDGVGWDLDGLAQAREAFERRGLDVHSAYGVLDLRAEPEGDLAAAEALDARLAPLRAALEALRGGPGMLWLALRHDSAPLRSTVGDADALRALRSLLEDARRTGVEIALYPHHAFWMETVDDALRLCERLDDRRLGVCFNLCHFLRTSDETSVRPAVVRAKRHLLAATVNGADAQSSDWSTLIRPLDEGNYPLRDFLDALDAAGFHGPVGLQAFGIPLEPRAHLARSMAAWRSAHAR